MRGLESVKIMKRTTTLFFCGLLLLITGLAQAKDSNRYQVELIIFEDINSTALGAETWPSHPPLPTLKNTRELIPYRANGANGNLQLLPSNRLKLLAEESQLQDKYRVLLHIGWIQTFNNTRRTKPIHIYAGKFHKTLLERTDYIYSEPPYTPEELWRIDGTLSLSKTNYFNLATNLVFNLAVGEVSQRTDRYQSNQFLGREVASFRMIQERRMRPDEIHYLDHPLFGMIVKISSIGGASSKKS